MAISTLPGFTPTSYTQVCAQPYAQVVALPSGGGTTALITCMGTEPAVVVACTPVESPTATQATVGASTIVVSAATGILVGQLVIGAGIQAGTYVTSIASTTVGISQPTTAALSTTNVFFFTAVTNSSGIAVTPNWPLPLGVGSNAYLGFICHSGPNSVLNIAVGN